MAVTFEDLQVLQTAETIDPIHIFRLRLPTINVTNYQLPCQKPFKIIMMIR